METSERTTTTGYAGRHRIVDHAAPSLPGYDVVEPIAEGGSGTVWSATAPDGSAVAVKVVSAVDADDALVELAVLGRLRDPHLVRLHEALTLPTGEVALVLDHLAGGTLGSVVRTRGHLAPGELVTVMSPVASTLARLHGLGVVHGDLSPENVLLDLDGRPFVTDLGVARIVGADPTELRGTEGFVAPEVLAGGLHTAAADVHALGALAWFCLTGEAPGPAVVRGRLTERVPGLPEGLVESIEQALRSRPEERPDADALALAIFESAPAQPLVLASGSDDVGLLTRRIRAAARSGEAPSSEQPGVAHGSRRVPGWLGAGLDGIRRTRPRAGGGVVSVSRRLVDVGRVVLPWVAVAAVVAATVLGALSWLGTRDDARASTASAERGSVPEGVSMEASQDTSASAPGDARLDADAPRRDAVKLVQALADARAQAWASGLAARLVEVDAARSPALARDTEVLAGVQRERQRYVGLTFTVREAVVVGASSAEAAGGPATTGARRGTTGERVTVRARIDTGAHVVRGPSGAVPRPAVPAAPVLLDLVRTGTGWRVHDVRAV